MLVIVSEFIKLLHVSHAVDDSFDEPVGSDLELTDADKKAEVSEGSLPPPLIDFAEENHGGMNTVTKMWLS